jgi:glyoxylase-like metal-dependent hydrolase (beta-lactamase superfamily II)
LIAHHFAATAFDAFRFFRDFTAFATAIHTLVSLGHHNGSSVAHGTALHGYLLWNSKRLKRFILCIPLQYKGYPLSLILYFKTGTPARFNSQSHVCMRGFEAEPGRCKIGLIHPKRGRANAMQTETTFAPSIPLEDTFADILQKAQRGLKLSLDEIAERSGVSVQTIRELHQGQVNPEALEKLAFALNLHEPSLSAMAEGSWQPKPVAAFPGFAMFTTWFGDMTVNAYLAWDPQTREAASFDTGSSCQPMLDLIAAKGLQLKKIFITHTHMDHLADLDRLQQASEADSYGSATENPLGLKSTGHGDGFVLGCLRIRVLGTSGHTPGGLSYFIRGLEKPIVVVGDALFAGSMGGAPHAYQEALRNNRERILALPPETIIAPGHGPLTTVGEERAHNAFFPELKY